MIDHIPALQVILPIFIALCSGISFNRNIAWIITLLGSLCCFLISVYGLLYLEYPISYIFGDWEELGIEYKINLANQRSIVFANTILLLFIGLNKRLIDSCIIDFIEVNRQHIFYSLLLFAHLGFIGILSTNDLFNLYVFIEISSLATYVLVSQGGNPKALIGAFNYLIFGTIGAVLILIAIGFLLLIAGSLNMDVISGIINMNSRIIALTIALFITGIILKSALFPLHFWMISAYSNTSSVILSYLSPISTISTIYLIIKFLSLGLDQDLLSSLNFLLNNISLIAIIVPAILAVRSDNFKRIIIYSSMVQIGYIFLMISNGVMEIIFPIIAIDAVNKVVLFIILANIESNHHDLSLDNFPNIRDFLFKSICAFALIFSAGLPITSMFLIKIKIFSSLLEKNLLIEFILVIVASILSLFYHSKLAKAIFFSNCNSTLLLNGKQYPLVIMIIMQIITVFIV